MLRAESENVFDVGKEVEQRNSTRVLTWNTNKH